MLILLFLSINCFRTKVLAWQSRELMPRGMYRKQRAKQRSEIRMKRGKQKAEKGRRKGIL